MTDKERDAILEHMYNHLKSGHKVYPSKLAKDLGINFHGDHADHIADIIVTKESHKYTRGDRNGNVYVQLIIPKRLYEKPFYEWAIKAIISAVITTAIGLLLVLPKSRQDTRENNQQNKRLNALSDSIAILQNRIDALK